MSVHFSSKSDEWATPAGFAERYGPFDLDPAATAENAKAPKFYTKAECGLTRPWSGRVWLNPPYGRTIGLWVKKAVEAAQHGATVVCLLPARTDTRWWHDYVVTFGQVDFLKGRLKFGGCKNSAPFPSAVVTFAATRPDGGDSLREALRAFKLLYYPVCETIDPRGYSWQAREETLDYVKGLIDAALAAKDGG